MAGLYIHIPFCKSRCIYCGFYSTTGSNLQDAYVKTLCREMEIKVKKGYLHPTTINTIYIGGGTPSQLSPENLRRLFIYIYKVYDVACDAEITMECNPDDITIEYADMMRSLKINRVSMGAQTFNDERLRFIRRRHASAQTGKAVKTLREAGINNISIDLMFGFPNETLEEWLKDIDCAIRLDVEHISAYSLTFEEETPLFLMLEKGKVEEIDEELSRRMYYELAERLQSAGFEHYEISNFARPGYRSRHNSSYWQGIPYIGIGAAAHSFDIKSRQWNVSDINEYIRSINKGEIPMEREMLDIPTRYDDTVMTALRTCEGVNVKQIEETFGTEYSCYLLKNALKHINLQLLEHKDGCLRLTREGLFVSDSVISDLMYV